MRKGKSKKMIPSYIDQKIRRPIPPQFQHLKFSNKYTLTAPIAAGTETFPDSQSADNSIIAASTPSQPIPPRSSQKDSVTVEYIDGIVIDYIPADHEYNTQLTNHEERIPELWIVEYEYKYKSTKQPSAAKTEDGEDDTLTFTEQITEAELLNGLIMAKEDSLVLSKSSSTARSNASSIPSSSKQPSKETSLASIYQSIVQTNTTQTQYYQTTIQSRIANGLDVLFTHGILWKLILCSALEIEFEYRIKQRLELLLAESDPNNSTTKTNSTSKRKRTNNNNDTPSDDTNTLPKWYTSHPTSYLGGQYKYKANDIFEQKKLQNQQQKEQFHTLCQGNVSSTPSTIANRVKSGIQKACMYYFHSQTNECKKPIEYDILMGLKKKKEVCEKEHSSHTTTNHPSNTIPDEFKPKRVSKRLQHSHEMAIAKKEKAIVEQEEEEGVRPVVPLPSVMEVGGCVALTLIDILKEEEEEIHERMELDQYTGNAGEYVLSRKKEDGNGEKENGSNSSNCVTNTVEGGKNENDEGNNDTKMEIDNSNDNDDDNDDDDDENDDDDDENDENEEMEVDLDTNPHYKPSIHEIYSHLYHRVNKPSASITPADIQTAICFAMEDSIDCCLPLLEPNAVLHNLNSLIYQTLDKFKFNDDDDEEEIGQDVNDNDDDEENIMKASLECVSGDSIDELQSLEVAAFARFRFGIQLSSNDQRDDDDDHQDSKTNQDGSINDTDKDNTILTNEEQEAIKIKEEEVRQLKLFKIEEKKRLAMLKFRQEERAWRDRKHFETWRYTSIQSGKTIWPKWKDHAMKMIKEISESSIASSQNATNDKKNGDSQSSSAQDDGSNSNMVHVDTVMKSTGGTSEEGKTDLKESNDQEAKDFELAQKIAQTANEETSTTITTSRRSRRSAQIGTDRSTSNLVFYGSQQSFSVQQLLESVERLIVQSYPRGMMLLELKRLLMDEGIGGEKNRSSGVNLYGSIVELKKVRTALGKLMFRLGKVDRILVNSDSDLQCWNFIKKGEEKKLVTFVEVIQTSSAESNAAALNANKGVKVEQIISTDVVEDKNNPEVEQGSNADVVKDQSDQSNYDDKKESNKAENSEQPVEERGEVKEEDENNVAPTETVKAENDPNEPPKEELIDQIKVSEEQIIQEKREIEILEKYMCSLHVIELHLREMLLRQHRKGAQGMLGFQQISPSLLALAADERSNDQEGMDRDYFFKSSEDENGEKYVERDDIEWTTSPTHSFLGKIIYRPFSTGNPDELLHIDSNSHDCSWFMIQSYCPSKPLKTNGEDSKGANNTSNTDNLNENTIVERRSRFLAVAYDKDQSKSVLSEGKTQQMILTESQVLAGVKAAEFVDSLANQQKKNSFRRHPFAGMEGMNYILYAQNKEQCAPLHAIVVGQDTVISPQSEIKFRVLVLVDTDKDSKPAFWANLSPDATSIECIETDESYRLEPQEYHPSSAAYKACEAVLAYLQSHVKIVPFLEPVDPIQLNIPDYFDVIKNPMDLSTIEKKLQDGKYGRLSPSNVYSSPVCKMLYGPFYHDLMLIFDNAMLYNPKGDWIHNDAKSLKSLATKKVQTIAMKAEREAGGAFSNDTNGRSRSRNQSVYVEVDSDEDMYEYESDFDDEYTESNLRRGGKRKRSRSKPAKVEDFATRAIESPVRVPNFASSNITSRVPLVSDARLFGLPRDWSCRKKGGSAQDEKDDDRNEDANDDVDEERELEQEREELIMLQMHIDQQSLVRRSARAATTSTRNSTSNKGGDQSSSQIDVGKSLDKVEFFLVDSELTKLLEKEEHVCSTANDRQSLEVVREKLHEEYYAKLYYKHCSTKKTVFAESLLPEGSFGTYTGGYFPPYMGRIVPDLQIKNNNDVKWEIRSQFVIPALRWTLRGLVESGHIAEWEPSSLENMEMEASVLANHIYYQNKMTNPFEVLDVKEMQRRKRAEALTEKGQREEEEKQAVELSAYEKMRADRVARNKERLKLLGLA